MSDMFDYLSWRGDILFSQLPPNPVDALIFSTLSYIQFTGIVPEDLQHYITLRDAAMMLLDDMEDAQQKVRVKADLDLLRSAAATDRFGRVGLSMYRDVFDPEADTQFAAMTFFLEDGTAFLAFRGTDNTLVGWKEDFNMTFQQSIPAQRLALQYVQDFCAASKAPMHLGGHSKGGNLAVYAAAKCDYLIQKRIITVYNQDGPGFSEEMMDDPGYLNIVPKIRTYVPQSSIFGMLLEHEEPYIIIKSKQIGLMQHDPYSWEVMGGNFIPCEDLSSDSRFLDRTFRSWLAQMTREERNTFFDHVFDLLMVEKTSKPKDIIKPQNLITYIKTLQSDDTKRQLIARELANLVRSAHNAQYSEPEN
ncbi:MAG: DUF2974 domain-containing protein [Oscillospiraceae bacterium]|nr:DUF2974 domain-containing protein [Oscillospiraceae bacterium]